MLATNSQIIEVLLPALAGISAPNIALTIPASMRPMKYASATRTLRQVNPNRE
jgi:hypothetical protein